MIELNSTEVLILALIYLIGLVCAFFALWRSRTPQGAAAWVVALITLPFLTVPFFLLLGRNKFYGYVRNRKNLDARAGKELEEAQQIQKAVAEPDHEFCAIHALASNCGQAGYTDGNALRLLINASEAYESLFQEIENAKNYVLFQFYIIRDDKIGRRFAEALRKKAREGVRVYFLYDSVGTSLPRAFLKELRKDGVETAAFRGMRYWTSHAQVNFRNHRKNVVIDGRVAFTGGLNVGDDYLGEYPEIGPWRDTHVRIEGPSALNAQIAFAKDWYWARKEIPNLDWAPHPVSGGSKMLVLATGPADEGEPCLLTHLHLISSAKKRLWIANPYFVPPESFMHALELAVRRKVDVRLLIPQFSDNKWITYASEVYLERALKSKIPVFAYKGGFLHEKVVLVDDKAATVGSVNLDSRSFFINFEITSFSHDPDFVGAVEKMLKEDFRQSQPLKYEDYRDRSLWRQVRSRAVALMSPML